MKNEVFMKKTAEQKRRYLSGVLKAVGGGVLTDETTKHILAEIAIHKQYAISVFSDNRVFREAVARAGSGKVRMSLVSQQIGKSAVVAVITPVGRVGSKNSKRVIYIYTPIQNAGKRAKEWARIPRGA